MESVQSTNNEAARCRAAAVQSGLFDDPHIHLFCSARECKEPLILKGTAIRTLTLNRMLGDAIGRSTRPCQVLNLGCGFDTRCLMFPDTVFYEVDVPAVIAQKTAIIARSGIHSHAKFIPCDINDVDTLLDMLAAAGLSFSCPTILFAECCLMYLDRQSIERMVEGFAERCHHLTVITFDGIKGDDEFGRHMMSNLGLRMPFFESCVTVDDYLAGCGGRLELVDSFDLLAAEGRLGVEDRQRIMRLCPLDEYEEWRLISSHYVFALFSSVPCL